MEGFRKVFLSKRFETSSMDIEFVNDEKEMLEKFKEIIEAYKPDILTGYFSDGFDLPYIKTRAEKIKSNSILGGTFQSRGKNRERDNGFNQRNNPP